MRPRLGSRPLRQMPTHSPGRRGPSSPGRRGAARSSGRGGATRSRVPLRHRVALWTLPRLLIFPKHDKSPARAGLFLFLVQGSVPMESERSPEFLFDAFSLREPVSTHGSSPRACFAGKRYEQSWRRLTSSSDDGASSGGANDGGDASPDAGDASPSAFGPSRDDDRGRGPSALLPA